MVITCDTLATESFIKPVSFDKSMTFPGACAKRRLELTTTARTVFMRLLLKASEEMIITGRRYPASDPRGSGKFAHQISPRFITNLPHG